jgi:hypothetical protein
VGTDTDPMLPDVPLSVPAGMIICLLALTITAWPVLAGEHASARRQRQATWGSWACLAAAVIYPFTGAPTGLYGFLTLAAIAGVAALTLLRLRRHAV